MSAFRARIGIVARITLAVSFAVRAHPGHLASRREMREGDTRSALAVGEKQSMQPMWNARRNTTDLKLSTLLNQRPVGHGLMCSEQRLGGALNALPICKQHDAGQLPGRVTVEFFDSTRNQLEMA